jgi:hypothetical protein
MRAVQFAHRRRFLLGLLVGCALSLAGCGSGGGSGGSPDPKKGEEMKQKKLDSMKEIMQKKLAGKGSR